MESVTDTAITRNSDSGYSNSCSNSNSRKSASSKSKHSESNSSGSSGRCGTGNARATDANSSSPVESATATTDGTLDMSKCTTKGDKAEHKKKELKSSAGVGHSNTAVTAVATATTNIGTMTVHDTSPQAVKEPVTDSKMVVEMVISPSIPKDVVVAEEIVNKGEQVEEQLVNTIPVLSEQDLVAAGLNTAPAIADTPLVMIDGVIEDVQPIPVPHWSKNVALSHAQEAKEKLSKTGTAQASDAAENESNENKTHITQPENGFCCVISMYDGVVLYTTPGLTTVLGFPKDMWLGRSFIDFVHPKDREAFSSQVTTGIALPLVDAQKTYKDYKNSLYVCLRKYRGLKSSGFGVVDKGASYQAFQLTVKFKYVAETAPEKKCLDVNSGMFLVIIAIPLYTYYKGEKKKSTKFGMRHTASCKFSHVDPDVVTNFGFLPQDMLGKSVFDFYHPEDMPFLKEIYESVMQMCQIAGSVFRSKPYRFAVQNGGFAMIETEWSSFVNPWSRRLEFVVGLHRVLEGPPNPDIFEMVSLKDIENVSEEVTNESKLIQEEILLLLNKLPRPTEVAKQEASKRCKDLANLMETLMDEVSMHQLDLPPRINPTISIEQKRAIQQAQHGIDDHLLNHNNNHHSQPYTYTNTPSHLHNQQQLFNAEHHLLQEHDSVMLGEISPHHDYYDSKSSSETPPSYNQLNYNENLQRFFESKPKTTVSDESTDSSGVGAMQQNHSGGESDAKPTTSTHHIQDSRNTMQDNTENSLDKSSPLQQKSGDMSGSGSGSAGYLSSASNPNMDTLNLTIVSRDSYKPLHLTESILSRHNEDMEKRMLKKHREQRFTAKENKRSHTNNHHHNQTYHYNHKSDQLNVLERANINHRVEHVTPVPLQLPPSGGAHGVKRCGSYSPEGASDNHHKISKHRYKSGVANQKEEVDQSSFNHNGAQQVVRQQVNIYKNQPKVHAPMVCNGEMSYQNGVNEVDLWPPFSVAATPLQTQTCINSVPVAPGTSGRFTTTPTTSVFPFYYLPTAPSMQRTLAGTTPYSDPAVMINPAPRHQVQFMPGLFLNHGAAAAPTLYPSSPMLYPTLPVMQMPLLSSWMRPAANPTINTLQLNGHGTGAAGAAGAAVGLEDNSNNRQRTTALPNQNSAAQIEQKVTDPVVSGLQRFQRRASQDTSVKVEMGSAMSSVASASLANKALTESSSHDLGLPISEMEPFLQQNDNKKEVECDKKQHESVLQQRLDATNHPTTMDESSSCYSSSYSSFLNTDTGTGSGSNDDYNPNILSTGNATAHKNLMKKNGGNGSNRNGCHQLRKKDPPWLESVQVSHDLVYRYQMAVRDIEDILKADLDTLKGITQPVMVNDQLSQLYFDMELEGLSQKLTLEEGITSSSSSGEDATNARANIPETRKKRKMYSSSVIIYEEDVPLPSPTENF